MCLRGGEPSFIVVTGKDAAELEQQRRKESRLLLKKVFSFFGAVSAGVLGNYAYYYMNL